MRKAADWTQFSINIAYGGTANEGVKAYILKEKDDVTGDNNTNDAYEAGLSGDRWHQ